jgi:hypothetical protein
MPAKKRAVHLNADLHKALTAKSAAMDLTVAELVSKATRAYLADAADEATFGRQEPSLSFRGAGKKGAKKGAKKVGKKAAKKGGRGKTGAKKGRSKKRRA